MKLVIIFCVIIGHVYAGPTPCIDLCGQVDNVKTSRASQSYLTHSSLSHQNTLRDLQQSLIDQLQKTHQDNLQSSRPGNWTEHNDYVTDDGAGSVHEERGQLVNGGSQVRYYKKNYSASHGTDLSGVNNGGTSSLRSDQLNVQNMFDRTNVQTYEQPSFSNQQNSQVIDHSLHSSTNDNLARLENFGEQTNTQIHEDSNSGIVSNNNDNWKRHNSFVTDGGHGKVYEEEGQYHQGPTKVRYYKKNYTSSFSTSGGDGSGIAMIPIVNLPNINSHIDTQMNQMRSELERVNDHINQQTHHLSTSYDNSNLNRATDINRQHDYHSRNYINTNQHVPQGDSVGLTREIAYGKLSTSENTHGVHASQVGKPIYVPTLDINSEADSQSSHQQQHQYQNQRHNQDTTIRIPIYRRTDGIHISGDTDSVLRHQQLNLNENHRNDNLYSQRLERIPVQPQIERHVEQHWSASEHQSHSTIPQQIIITHPQGISDAQQLNMFGQQQYGSLSGFENGNRGKYNNNIAGSSSSYHQQYETKTHRDDIHSETLRHGHQGALDCDDATHINYNSQHGTRYKRDADYSQHNEDLTQQNDQTIAKLELGQQYEKENVQATQGYHNDYSQHHSGNLELDSQQITHGFEDFTQQQSGNLEFNQHQSPTGQLEFGQPTGNHDHHGYSNQYQHHNSHGYADHDLGQQATQNFEDFTQQHSGNLEINQQHQSQQGQLEFGQQVGHYDHREPFGQYRHHNSPDHADQDSTQQSTHGFEDYTQQHTEHLEHDQQHQDSNGHLEFGRSEHHNHHEPHEQHRHHHPHGHADQDSTQQVTHGFEDYTQQHSEFQGHHNHDRDNQFGNYGRQQYGSLEFGQQHEQQQSGMHNHEQQVRDNHNHHRGRQNENLSPISQGDQPVIAEFSGNEHFGQQYVDDLSQQTGNIGDFSQQTSSNSELVQPTRNGDLSQTNDHDFGSSKPAPKPISRPHRIGNYERGDTAIEPISRPIGVKGGHRGVSRHQNQFNSHYSQPIVEQSGGVVSLEQQIRKDESVNVFQPRILEAYGGNGPYDANHNENIYADVKPNPTATLAPINDGKESWDVREPSANDFLAKNGEAELIKSETSIKLDQEYTPTTTEAPGFWKRIGNKITSTYEKAKDKVTDVFG